jgi:hypothetical protein
MSAMIGLMILASRATNFSRKWRRTLKLFEFRASQALTQLVAEELAISLILLTSRVKEYKRRAFSGIQPYSSLSSPPLKYQTIVMAPIQNTRHIFNEVPDGMGS